MITYTIEVTQDDIDNGEPRRTCFCPIARALKRTLKVDDDFAVSVGRWNAASDVVDGKFLGDSSIEGDLPPEASDFVSAFDKGEHVEPFTFLWSTEVRHD